MTKNNLTIPNIKSASHFLWPGAMLAAFWIGMNLVFPQIAQTGIPTIITDITIHGVILTGLWLGLSHTTFTYRTRVTLWFAIVIPFTLWRILIFVLAMHGVFRAVPGIVQAPPWLPIAIFLPAVAGLTLLTRSSSIASLLDVMPASWLIGLQLYRILGGGLFLVNWLHGILPGAFALPAGIGDVAVGVLALLAAAGVASGTEAGRKAGMRWNILGLVDLSVAIAMGMMTSPGAPLHVTGLGQANMLLGAFPTVMIPAFAVPSSIILHGLSIWQLKRQAKRAELSPVGTQHQLSV
jgi:hypothetical protein